MERKSELRIQKQPETPFTNYSQAKIAQRAKKVQVRFKPLLVIPFTPGRDTCNFPHISLKALNEKIDNPLKPYLEADLKAVLKSLTRFSVPMFSPHVAYNQLSAWLYRPSCRFLHVSCSATQPQIWGFNVQTRQKTPPNPAPA